MKCLIMIAIMMLTLTVSAQTVRTNTKTVATPVTITSTNKSGVVTKSSKIELTKLTTKRVSNPNAPVVTKTGNLIITTITNKDGTITTSTKDRKTGAVTINTSVKQEIKQEMMIGQPPPNIPPGMVLRGAGMRSSVKTEVKNNVTVKR